MRVHGLIASLLIGMSCLSWALQNDAYAGFLEDSINVNFPDLPDPPGSGPPSWVFELMPDGSGNGHLVLGELFGPKTIFQIDPLVIEITGITNGNISVLTFTQHVLNSSGLPWIGYDITLFDDSMTLAATPTSEASADMTNGYAMFVGTASSNVLTPNSMSPYSLTFGPPGQVGAGVTATFTFDVGIPTSGPFMAYLLLTPLSVPEPGTASLFVLGLFAFVLLPFRRVWRAPRC